MKETTQTSNIVNWRLYIIYGVLAFIFLFYTFRLFSLQIIRGDEFLTQAEENRTKEINLLTQRGIIYDRNGYILARNIPSYNVVITPANLPEDEGSIQDIYRQLSDLVGVPVSKGTTDEETVRNFSPCISDLGISQVVEIGDSLYPYSPIKVKCYIDETTAKIIRRRQMTGRGWV
jgi:penicillin-binding protein 2